MRCRPADTPPAAPNAAFLRPAFLCTLFLALLCTKHSHFSPILSSKRVDYACEVGWRYRRIDKTIGQLILHRLPHLRSKQFVCALIYQKQDLAGPTEPPYSTAEPESLAQLPEALSDDLHHQHVGTAGTAQSKRFLRLWRTVDKEIHVASRKRLRDRLRQESVLHIQHNSSHLCFSPPFFPFAVSVFILSVIALFCPHRLDRVCNYFLFKGHCLTRFSQQRVQNCVAFFHPHDILSIRMCRMGRYAA